MTTATKAQKNATQQTIPADETPLLNEAIEVASDKLDAVAGRYCTAILGATGHLRRAMLIAAGVDELRRLIDGDMMKRIMSLMNSPLGFMCDRPNSRNSAPYTEREVKDVLIAALLQGVFPVGNEFNVISGRLYIAQNGYRRLVKEIPGLTDLRLSPGIPTLHNGHTVVRVGASWKMEGVKQALVDAEGKAGRVFAIATNQGSTADNTVGKATRKALKAIYEQVMGSDIGPEDGEVTELETPEAATEKAQTKVEQLQQKLQLEANPLASRSQLERIQHHIQAPDLEGELADTLERAGKRSMQELTRDEADSLLLAFQAIIACRKGAPE